VAQARVSAYAQGYADGIAAAAQPWPRHVVVRYRRSSLRRAITAGFVAFIFLGVLPGLDIVACRRWTLTNLSSSIGRPIEAEVAERIVADTGGNPLAVVEDTRALTPEQLGGRAPLPDPVPVGHRLERLFEQRVRELPTDTQTLPAIDGGAGPYEPGGDPVAGGRPD
jgi:hypothetical protein